MKRCHKCGKEWVSAKRQPGPKDWCDGCTAYLHSCLNCRFRDPHAHNQCHIPNTEWVSDRAGMNYCDEFEFADTEIDSKSGAVKERARGAFGSLFGGDEEKPKNLDDFKKLFGD